MNGFLKVIIDAAINNNLLIFVGAGASIGLPHENGLPSGNQLNEKLILSFGENETLSTFSLEKTAEYLEGKYGRRTIIDKVKSIIKNCETPISTHKLIAELSCEIIVTTNYDDLIEKALHDIGKNHVTITSDIDLINLSKTDVKVFKIHGCVNTQNDDFILSEKDYYEKFLLNTSLYKEVLKSWLSTHTCLFIGYSLSDINLKHLFFDISQKLKIENIKGKFYSVQRSPSDVDIQIWEKRGFIVIKANQNDFINDVIDEVEFHNFERNNSTLKSKQNVKVGKLSLQELNETEEKSGADEQRFILLSKRKMDFLKVKDGNWIDVTINGKMERIKAFQSNSIGSFDLKMPLTVRYIFQIKNTFQTFINVELKKSELETVSSLRITPNDIITLLPLNFDNNAESFQTPVLTIRNLEFELLDVIEGQQLNLRSLNEPLFSTQVKVYKFKSNPGRALIGVNTCLKELLDELNVDLHDLRIEK